MRDRRMATASHLLERTTQPVASIAASVGFSDVQAFNKACRRYLGASPRAVRRETGRGTGESVAADTDGGVGL
ncbi:helix-turn-helix domain-containing protein [Microbacterium sp. R86528]|uniref:helix-turn-helix domain-containing protein n=1 Tax=Microbacterium sp. R86528 TaxID=3093864 RepID=UPI0037C57126